MAKLMYVGTHATDDVTKAALPFHLARGARAEGIECCIYLVAEAVYLMKEKVAESIFPVGFPPLKELLQGVIQEKVPIYV
jgi:predicted peroxiredoxin